MMNSYKCEKLTKEDIIKIYTELAPDSFPAEELRPLSNINSLLERGGYEGLGLYKQDDCVLLGYAFFIKVPGMSTALLDFYAVLREYRCLGIGSIFLQEIRGYYQDLNGLILETEDTAFAANEEEFQLRNRRNAFYFKNGARQTTLSCSIFDSAFRILFLPTSAQLSASSVLPANADISDAEIKKLLDDIYHFMLPGEWYTKGVLWRS